MGVAQPPADPTAAYRVSAGTPVVRTPLVLPDGLYYVDAARRHLAAARGDEQRVVLPSLPAGAVLSRIGTALQVASARGARFSFAVRDAIATCPVPVHGPWTVDVLLRFVSDEPVPTWAQVRVEEDGFRIDCSVAADRYDAFSAALRSRPGVSARLAGLLAIRPDAQLPDVCAVTRIAVSWKSEEIPAGRAA